MNLGRNLSIAKSSGQSKLDGSIIHNRSIPLFHRHIIWVAKCVVVNSPYIERCVDLRE